MVTVPDLQDICVLHSLEVGAALARHLLAGHPSQGSGRGWGERGDRGFGGTVAQHMGMGAGCTGVFSRSL